MKVWRRIDQGIAQGGTAALISVVHTDGSVPRAAGARMVLTGDGFAGTIGGGALEWRILAEAQADLAGGRPHARTLTITLGPDTGQCCGGRVHVLIETFSADDAVDVARLAQAEAAGPFSTVAQPADGRWRRSIGPARERIDTVRRLSPICMHETYGVTPRRLWLFGAGHVGRALVVALAPHDFDVMWLDQRHDAFPPVVPGRVSTIAMENPVVALDKAVAGDFIVIMTHSHPLDLALVDRALRLDAPGYVGVIGSATKRARFRSQLASAGHTAPTLDRMVCPIGAGGPKSRLPAAIAASVVVELLIADEAQAAAGCAPVLSVAGGHS